MPLFAGRIVLADDAVEGWLEVEAGRTVDWGEGAPPAKAKATGWIVPAPVNAHTHVADTCLRDKPGKPATVAELVGPGGWKQRNLAAASPQEVAAGIQLYADEMAATGCAAFLDFREGGLAGVQTLRALADDLAVPATILGRPLRNDFKDDEARDLLATADGIGLSARRDFARAEDVEAWADACHRAGKTFALHASEAKREPIDDLIALEPAFLVHTTAAEPRDWRALADADVPVVVSPRSNGFYGVKTPVPSMLDAGLRLAVGTDNGMLHDGDLWKDLAQLHAWFPKLGTAELLRMATYNARELAGLSTPPPRKGASCDFIVLPAEPWPRAPDGRPGFVPAHA